VSSAEGIETCRFGWRAVNGHACESAIWLARVMQRQGWQGVPKPCSPRCPVTQAFPAPRPRSPELIK
jgi:hypothetical protein